MQKRGRVYLVGAGPGDPSLITVKGIQSLRRADVVLYDRLVNPKLLLHARSDAEKICVGKPRFSQKGINRILVEKASDGKVVVRLKGGDPMLFSRGGEEALMLARAEIEFEIVPGVTSAIAAPTYAGIPLTFRGISSSVAFATGHNASGGSTVDFEGLAKVADTLVILMGTKTLRSIVRKLKQVLVDVTPVAIVAEGTTPNQKVVTGTLNDILTKTKSENIQPPATIVVGEVVGFRRMLDWIELENESVVPLTLVDKKLAASTRKSSSRAAEQAERQGLIEEPSRLRYRCPCEPFSGEELLQELESLEHRGEAKDADE